MVGWGRAGSATVLAMAVVTAGQAQSPEELYRGKTVEIYIGYTVGGGYDIYARMLARHMGKHIPGNPTVVAKNMEGAASLRLANWLARAAPKDGTVFGTIGRGTAFDPLLGQKGAQFEGTDFGWIGSANDEVSICASWVTSKITRFEDMRTQEMTIGGTGASDDTVQFAKVLNNVLGTRLKIVTGYPGGNDIVLAMERGEVEGRCGWSWSSIKTAHPAWITQKTINVLIQLALAKHPDLPDVPLISDFAKSEDERQIIQLIFGRQVMGRPFLAPPGVAPERLAVLRRAFMDTMNDAEFRADADKAKLEITPVPGEKVEALVRDIYRTPRAVAQRAAAALN